MMQATAAAPVTPGTVIQYVQTSRSTIILVIALVVEFLLLLGIFWLISPRVKEWLKDFPTHPANVVVALFLITITGVVIANKLVLGQPLPDGYEFWMISLIALAGVNVGGLAVKRFSDYRYREIKNQTQEFNIPAERVQINSPAPAAAAPPAAVATPAATAAPAKEASEVRAGLDVIAARQRSAEHTSPDDVPGQGD